MTNSQLIQNKAISENIYTEDELELFFEKNEFLPLNTFQGWKSLGYSVKKGEKAKIKTKLWKYTNHKTRGLTEEEYEKLSQIMDKVPENEEVPEKPNHYYLAPAALFDISQVQRVKKEETEISQAQKVQKEENGMNEIVIFFTQTENGILKFVNYFNEKNELKKADFSKFKINENDIDFEMLKKQIAAMEF